MSRTESGEKDKGGRLSATRDITRHPVEFIYNAVPSFISDTFILFTENSILHSVNMNPASEKGSDHDHEHNEHAKHLEHAHGGDAADLTALGYKPELQRNRSMFTLLFQSLAIAAVCPHPLSLSLILI